MSVPPGEEIGDELHQGTDQIFIIVDGDGEAIVGGRTRAVTGGDTIVVPAGTRHNVRNTGGADLKLYAVCAPPAFAEGTIHRTREDAVGAMIARRPAYSS
jgi:mannose-6-phosphate isomerase-like protein (cupin superfamily)